MGNNRQVILKIFRLDKNIYNELASEVSNFQIAIAIYISGFLFSGLAALNFLRNSLVYLEENLGLIVGTAIFALVCLGSGLKQVYLLRNIEAFLLVVVSGFGSSLFSQVI